MKAFVLAAGLGTRLRPWTLSHPKALVPVAGIPMLQRVICKLREQGFDEIVVNVHHFADQIVDFLDKNDFGVTVDVSDESHELLDTGGALVKALPLLDSADDAPFLVHNVDILSDAPLAEIIRKSQESSSSATLLVSQRDSSRRLVFSRSMSLEGWRDNSSGRVRPEGFEILPDMSDYAFSGIYAARPSMIRDMQTIGLKGKFGVMDYFLNPHRNLRVEGWFHPSLHLIDIGKPATESQANEVFSDIDTSSEEVFGDV